MKILILPLIRLIIVILFYIVNTIVNIIYVVFQFIWTFKLKEHIEFLKKPSPFYSSQKTLDYFVTGNYYIYKRPYDFLINNKTWIYNETRQTEEDN